MAPGRWRGVPLSNYAGWLGASAALVAVVEALLPDADRAGDAAAAGLLALYTWMGGLEAFGFTFVFGDPLVGLATALAMLPPAVAAWRARAAASVAPPPPRRRPWLRSSSSAAGSGGLAAALRLRAAGHGVTLCEAGARVGGKLAALTVDGFTWDTGPSLLTLPSVFDDLLRTAGTTLADEVDLVRLDPACRYRGPAARRWTSATPSTPPWTRSSAWRRASPPPWCGSSPAAPGPGRCRAARSSPARWSGRRSCCGGCARPGDLAAIDPLRTLRGRARRTFADPRLVQWAGRYATYSGSAPRRAPATLACIPWIEQRHGSWHVRGGLARLAEALGRVATARGVEIRTGADVAAVLAPDDGPVRGVRLADGTTVPADVVVADVDADHLYADLLPDAGALRRVRRAPRSSSGVALLLGVEGRTPGLAHHTVCLRRRRRRRVPRHLRPAGRRRTTPRSTCAAGRHRPDPGAARRRELVRAGERARRLGRRRRRLRRPHPRPARRPRPRPPRPAPRPRTITPADLEARFRDPGGAIYGTSSNGRRAAFLRPANRGARRGLYLVGGSSHPGGGLPLVARSGAIVAGMVAADGWR